MQVTINKELAIFIKHKLSVGDYNNSGEVVEEALLLLKQEDGKKAKLKSAVQAGYNDYKAGRLTDKSPKEIFNGLMQKEKLSNQ